MLLPDRRPESSSVRKTIWIFRPILRPLSAARLVLRDSDPFDGAGVVVAVVQKNRESAVARTVARRAAAGLHPTVAFESEVQQIIRDAAHWQAASLAVVFLAMVSWFVSLQQHEKCRGAWMLLAPLFVLYVLLELLMV